MTDFSVLGSKAVQGSFDSTRFRTVEVSDVDDSHATIPRFFESSNIASL